MYAIGVADQTDAGQLESVASHSGHVFQYANYEAMKKQYRDVVEVIVFGGEIDMMEKMNLCYLCNLCSHSSSKR